MKSGRKIFTTLVSSPLPESSIRALGNGDLRSLLLYSTKGRRSWAETLQGEQIIALAMCEAVDRWMRKGKGKAL